MSGHHEKTSTFFTKLAHGLGRKQRPAPVPLSMSLGSPAPQTSPIFELPDELILSILSHIAPDTQYTGHFARFRLQYWLVFDYCHYQRVRFLRPLGMTCKAMRLRLLPWIWERLEFPLPCNGGLGERIIMGRLKAVTNTFRADTLLATNVRFMTVGLAWSTFSFPSFVKCLQSLPNIHTLEIGRLDDFDPTPLKNALKGVRLPQVKTLILPPSAYPLLQHYHGVEDVVCVVKYQNMSPDGFLRSLTSNRDSKVKRLAIPLDMWANPSRFVAACPRLTELSVFPYPYDAQYTETEIILDPGGRMHSAMSELVVACKALPDFDTLQILRFPVALPRLVCRCRQEDCDNHELNMEKWKQALKSQAKDLEEYAINCLRKPRTECREGEGRRATLRVIEFIQSSRSVKVEEREV